MLNAQEVNFFRIYWIRNEFILLFVRFVKYNMYGSSGQGSVPKAMSNLSNFQWRLTSGVGKMWKCKISTIYWISYKASIFVVRDVKFTRVSASVIVQCPIAYGKVSYWGRIRDSKFKSLSHVSFSLCRDRCTNALDVHIFKVKYTGLITGWIDYRNLHFHILPPPGLGQHKKFQRLPIVLVTKPWPLDPNMWYFTYLKKSYLAPFLIQVIENLSIHMSLELTGPWQ